MSERCTKIELLIMAWTEAHRRISRIPSSSPVVLAIFARSHGIVWKLSFAIRERRFP